jgi:hypothetical protein
MNYAAKAAAERHVIGKFMRVDVAGENSARSALHLLGSRAPFTPVHDSDNSRSGQSDGTGPGTTFGCKGMKVKAQARSHYLFNNSSSRLRRLSKNASPALRQPGKLLRDT